MSLVTAANWPVVRRENEYTTIQAALADQPETCGIVIIGNAGVGKTTLARLVTRALPTPVHWVAGTESARSIPLGVFAPLVGTATSRDPIAVLAAARQALLSAGASVLGVDDAHLLDQLSATLLHQLALDGSVRIVATVRAGESVPDAITSLWKDGYLRRLYLTPFGKEQCVKLIEQAVGGCVEGLSADLMWDASGGNALFLRHLVEGALEAGTLRQVRGVWQLRGRTAVTSELASLLDTRVDQLPGPVLHALQVLTFCEPLDLDTLSEIVGADAVEEAETRGLIRVTKEHCINVRFKHPLFGEVIRRRLGMAASRRLSGELVRALKERPPTTPAERIRLAELTIDSDRACDVSLLVAAARDAVALSDITLGERLARAAVSRGGGLTASELLARSLLWQGNAVEAEEALRPFQFDELNDVDAVRWGLARIANLQWSMGDAESADEVLEMLRDRLSDPALRLLVDGVASASLLVENQLTQAVALSQHVLSDASASAAAVAWAAVGGVDGTVGGRFGGGQARVRHQEQGRRSAAVSDGLWRSSCACAGRRICRRGESCRRICADLVDRPVSRVEYGQRAGWHRRLGPRPIRRHCRPDGADRRGFDIRIRRIVELPGTAAAGAVVLCAGPGGFGRQDGGRAAHQVRQACRGVRAAVAHR
jgi:AAA ATPase domain